MKRALLLNADYVPLHFVSDTDAIILWYKGLVDVLAEWDEVWSSPSTSIHVPATLRLRRRVHKRWKPPRFRKKVLFNRDAWRCQYCGDKLGWGDIELEHVTPSSRGGQTTWMNCVASCHECNKRKGNNTPDEARMPLLKKPAVPSALHFWDALKTDCWHVSWEDWLPKPE